MQLDAVTYESDGEDHVSADAIAEEQNSADWALKAHDFKAQSEAVAAVKLHSSEQSCTIYRAQASGGEVVRCVARVG
jgi:hypothetical protein